MTFKPTLCVSLLLISNTVFCETLTVKYCPSVIDTDSSIKAKLSRLATDEIALKTQLKQQMLVEHKKDEVHYADKRLLSEPPVITGVTYRDAPPCKLGIYTY
jgi:hypothetical protein